MTVSNLKQLVYSHCLQMNRNMKIMNTAVDHLHMNVLDSTQIELLRLLGFGYVNIKYLIQRLEGDTLYAVQDHRSFVWAVHFLFWGKVHPV